MAIKPSVWAKAKALFEAGKPLSEIVTATGISKGQISKKSKAKGWQKETTKETLSEEVGLLIIEDELLEAKETILRKKETLLETPEAKKVYASDLQQQLSEAKKTHRLASNFQNIIELRQKADADAIEILILMKARDLKEAGEDLDARLRVEFKHREYLSIIGDYDEMKKGVEANDKAMITKGEAPRHAPKTDNINNTIVLKDSDEDFKGKF